ncbi:MAG: Uma2 family endonuclease, partial [Myxococcales bacterium]|nr:Uma2 family endonuclease [Myxococcales bacterium]
MTDAAPARMDYAAYLEAEAAAEVKHEYLRGEVYAMAGGTPEHAALAMAVGAELTLALRGRPCRVFSSDLRVRIEATDLSTYPDITVVCGALERSAVDPQAVVNPTLIVEVLSDSTEAYDRGEKFSHYRRLPSLRAYVLVSQHEARLEAYIRNDDGAWVLSEAAVGQQLVLDAVFTSPVALGRSEICLPQRAVDVLSPAQIQAILAHELAHLERRDPHWLALAAVIEALFFFQPLNRLARRGMQESAELLCDDWAIAATGDGVQFAKSLAELASWTHANRSSMLLAGMIGGERPLVRAIESIAGGAPLRGVVLGPDPITDLDALPTTDWSLLDRYRAWAPRLARQAQLYLSRGCPFDCAFCMERAKREVSWRAFSVERALAEVEGLHRYLDLRGWTLYFGDALFGMRKSWRREFLEGLARLDVPVAKYWLLIRVDLIEDEDLRLFAAANCGLGFGLESGDPQQLAIIRKSGRLDSYLDRMVDVAAQARERQVPWGANVICGHPGETPASMQRSADYLRALFLDAGGTTGFLSVDAFRLY